MTACTAGGLARSRGQSALAWAGAPPTAQRVALLTPQGTRSHQIRFIPVPACSGGRNVQVIITLGLKATRKNNRSNQHSVGKRCPPSVTLSLPRFMQESVTSTVHGRRHWASAAPWNSYPQRVASCKVKGKPVV